MSYGLSKFIKKLLPRRLFYRALLIVAVPIIVLQLIITIVFFELDLSFLQPNQVIGVFLEG